MNIHDQSSSDDSAAAVWIVTADMGYGHQRAVAPLCGLAWNGRIITAGKDDGSTGLEKLTWQVFRFFYEALSRLQRVPGCGKRLVTLLDFFLRINSLYPKRSQAAYTWQVGLLERLVRAGLCRGMLGTISTAPYPLITSFYAPAIATDLYSRIRTYCIICDTDLSRAWVARDPKQSRIQYFAPCKLAVQRLLAYGVPRDHIHLTGFPLPESLVGGPDLSVLKPALAARLHRLDPKDRFWKRHYPAIEHFLGQPRLALPPDSPPLTLTFAVGGAGAQTEIGAQLAVSLRERIQQQEIRLVLVAGVREPVKRYFDRLNERLFNGRPAISIVYGRTMEEYFNAFTHVLQQTDILWTKPSELVFYCALGIPLLLSSPIGAQERCNARWVYEIQAGFKQRNPRHAGHWLFDLLKDGRLAEAAWSGFLKARKLGTYNIGEFLRTGRVTKREPPLY